jgi:hypothetical protein
MGTAAIGDSAVRPAAAVTEASSGLAQTQTPQKGAGFRQAGLGSQISFG